VESAKIGRAGKTNKGFAASSEFKLF